MKWNILAAALLSVGMCTPSFGFDLLDQMLGKGGCGAESKCCASQKKGASQKGCSLQKGKSSSQKSCAQKGKGCAQKSSCQKSKGCAQKSDSKGAAQKCGSRHSLFAGLNLGCGCSKGAAQKGAKDAAQKGKGCAQKSSCQKGKGCAQKSDSKGAAQKCGCSRHSLFGGCSKGACQKDAAQKGKGCAQKSSCQKGKGCAQKSHGKAAQKGDCGCNPLRGLFASLHRDCGKGKGKGKDGGSVDGSAAVESNDDETNVAIPPAPEFDPAALRPIGDPIR